MLLLLLLLPLSVCRVLLLLSPVGRLPEALRLLQLDVEQSDSSSPPAIRCSYPSPGSAVSPFDLSVAERISAWLSAHDESAGKGWAASVRPLFPLSRAFGVQAAHTNGELASGEAAGSGTRQANGVVHD